MLENSPYSFLRKMDKVELRFFDAQLKPYGITDQPHRRYHFDEDQQVHSHRHLPP